MPGNETLPEAIDKEIQEASDDPFPGNSQPEANAPEPAVLREEMVNIILAENPACGRFRAEKIVDAQLAKQMQFYGEMAEAELDTSSVQAAVLLQELTGVVTALITMGAAVIQYMPDQGKWQRLARRARDAMMSLQGMVG